MSRTPKEIHALALAFSGELHDNNTLAYHHAKDVLTWLFDRPLANRLTDDEKERIRAIYNRKRFNTEHSKDVEFIEHQLLEYLLGKDFFKETEL